MEQNETREFPAGWASDEQYHPEQHLSKGRSNSQSADYLKVAERLVWFNNDQRRLIAAGLAKTTFVVSVKPVKIDTEAGVAVFEAYIRDCLGNEATDYGSETRSDFTDWIEKAATKAKGRALASIGYGTAYAPDLDEGERIVDSPREPRAATQSQKSTPAAPAKTTPTQQPQEPLMTRDALRNAFAEEFGYRGDEAWFTIASQVTGKTQAQLTKPGFSADDLRKMMHRLKLLRDAKTREQQPQAVAS